MTSEPLEILADGTKVKRRAPRMRACDERNEKGKPCHGHLKRWFSADDDLAKRLGQEIYRCERCKTLYLPNEDEGSRTRVMSW